MGTPLEGRFAPGSRIQQTVDDALSFRRRGVGLDVTLKLDSSQNLSVVTKFESLIFKRSGVRKAGMEWSGRFRRCEPCWSERLFVVGTWRGRRIDADVAQVVIEAVDLGGFCRSKPALVTCRRF